MNKLKLFSDIEIDILNQLLDNSIESQKRELFSLKGSGGNPKFVPEAENNLKNLKSIKRKINQIQ